MIMDCQISTIFNLPIELYSSIFKQFTIEELFKLYEMELPFSDSLLQFIQIYIHQKKYKNQSNLKDCMFLVDFEEYSAFVYEYLYELVTEIGKRIVYDVNQVGGSINYFDLAAEETPRNIYTIKILIMKEEQELEYKITSVGNFRTSDVLYYTYNFNHTSGGLQTIPLDNESVITTLIDIINLIKFDGRKIQQIRYYKEVYPHNYINLKSSIIYLTEGYDIK